MRNDVTLLVTAKYKTALVRYNFIYYQISFLLLSKKG